MNTRFVSAVASALLLSGAFGSVASAQTYYPATTPSYSYAHPSYCPQLYSNLQQGHRDSTTGGQVSRLQQFLATRYQQSVTGYFGPVTAQNVVQFQREQGLSPVGIVGPATRAAIQRVCGGTTSSNTFYLDSPFNLSVGQTATQNGGGLSLKLEQILQGGYYYNYNNPTSARITLTYSCPPGIYCAAIYAPTQTVDLALGQSMTFQGYTIRLNSLAYSSANFTVNQGTQYGQVTADIKANGSDGPVSVASGSSVNLSWTSSGASSCSVTPSVTSYTALAGQYSASMQNTITTGPLYQSATYTVTCYGYNGGSATDSVAITVGGYSQDFSASPTNGNAPLAVNFTVRGTDITGGAYSIDFGDGQQSVIYSGSVAHTYWLQGTFTAKLIYQPPFYCPPGQYCAQVMPAPQVVGTVVITVSGGSVGSANVSGQVTKGPVCPVASYYVYCPDQPFQTSINIYGGGRLIQSAGTDTNGYYNVTLSPGTYEFRANESYSGSFVYPICAPKTVTVYANQKTTANISCDTGIR